MDPHKIRRLCTLSLIRLGSCDRCRVLLLLMVVVVLLLSLLLLLLRLLVQRVSARKLLLPLQDANQSCDLPPQLYMLPCHHASLHPSPTHLPTSHPCFVLDSLGLSVQKAVTGCGMSAMQTWSLCCRQCTYERPCMYTEALAYKSTCFVDRRSCSVGASRS